MPDPKVDDPNSGQGSAVRVDALLSEVKQMADRVENLLGASAAKDAKPASPPKPAPAESPPPADPSAATAAPAENDKTTGESSLPAATEPAHDGHEVSVDPHTEQVAEDEISQALSRLGKREPATAGPTDAESAQADAAAAQDTPRPIRSLVQGLTVLDRPFVWVPRGIKDLLGYAGLATALLAIILWIVGSTTGK